MKIDRPTFYYALRKSAMFGGTIKQTQVDGMEAILAACEDGTTIPEAAYCLATAWHETAYTMQPVREALAGTTDEAIRRLDRAFDAGKLKGVKSRYWAKDSDGQSWLGRGFVQLTHKANYAKAAKLTGVDLLANPDAAMHPTVAALILVRGSVGGMFTGKALSRYLSGPEPDYVGARAVINGDVARNGAKIAEYAKQFAAALSESVTVQVSIPKQKPVGWMGAIIGIIRGK